MLQFFNKKDPSNEFLHILVAIPTKAIVYGFRCFEANEQSTYGAERFSEDNTALVPFNIAGADLRQNYELYDPEGYINFSWS